MAQINLRNALMTGKRLPYDAEVEFLESTGTQYIDTPVVWNPFTTKVTATFSTTVTGTQYIFGSYGRAHNFIGTRNASGSMQILPAAGLSSTFGDIHTVTAYNISQKYYEIIDGTEATISNANSDTTNILSIFRINGITTNIFNGRIYRLYLTDMATGQITADYIPVRKGTVGYLYDRVSGKLFGNAGTGDFVLGPDVVPVEYIESHGTEWIDTGVTYNYESDIDIQANVARMTDNRAVIVGNYYDSAHSAISLEFGGVANALTGRPRGYFRLGSESDGASLNLNSVPANTFIALGGRFTASTRYAEVASAADSASITLSRYAVINNGYTLKLFKDNRANSSAIAYGIKLATVQISQSDTQMRSFRPVRVGTDATSWEGAMMDVLTRRIYRNAGSGAFTYGNDLKYPIPSE